MGDNDFVGVQHGILVTQWTLDHMEIHRDVLPYIKEALGHIDVMPLRTGIFVKQIEMGRIVGNLDYVETAPVTKDELIIFAHRKNREQPQRVVLDKVTPDQTDKITCVFYKESVNQLWKLVTAWFGPRKPPDPFYHNGRTQEGWDFWCSHAFVYNSETMLEPFCSSWKEIIPRQGLKRYARNPV